MCGIAGFLGHYRPETLPQFLNALAHRGPDGSGVWQDRASGIGLAHRRLSIIGLSRAASQPMAAVGGRYQVVFNGEIYNHRSLHRLVADYDFNRDSDTAILAPLYDRFGPEMLDKLQGIFALAIWDREKRELFLARDHAGVKPLYLAETPEGLAFASELKVLAGLWGVDTSPDATALADYLTFLWSPGARTPINGIKKLLPGHWLKARMDGSGKVRAQVTRWFTSPLPELVHGKPKYDRRVTTADLRQLFDAVVAEQCTSDVPVGAFLSGGVDSSAIVAAMMANHAQAAGPRPVMTYCIGFAGNGMTSEGFDDDLHYAKQVAAHLDVPLTPVMVDVDEQLARLPGLAAMLDEPTADAAPLLVEDISRQARADGIKVLMSGTGGDDVMTGYRRHLSARYRQYLGPLRQPAGLACAGASHFSRHATRRRLAKLGGLLRADEDDFLRLAFMTNSSHDAVQLLHGDLQAQHRDQLAAGVRNALDVAAEESRGQDVVNRMLHMELAGFLPDHNLNYTDKAGMAHGVEIRVPFTDRRLMAVMSGICPKNKLHRTRLKAFFKDSMIGRLPQNVLHRSKTGFGVPIRAWMVGSGRGVMEETLLGGAYRDWLDTAAVERLWQENLNGTSDSAYTLLAVAMGIWWRQNLLRA